MEILSKTRRPDVTFHRSGRIDISSRVAERLGLRHGDAINAASAKGKIYIYISCKSKTGSCGLRGVCRRTAGNGFRAYSKALASALIKENTDSTAYASISAIFVKEYGRMLQIHPLS